MTDRMEKMIEELLDRVVRLETRLCKVLEHMDIPIERQKAGAAVFKYRNGVDISGEKC